MMIIIKNRDKTEPVIMITGMAFGPILLAADPTVVVDQYIELTW